MYLSTKGETVVPGYTRVVGTNSPWVHRWQLLVEPGGAAIMVGDSNQDGVRLLLNTPVPGWYMNVPGRYMGVPTIALESP